MPGEPELAGCAQTSGMAVAAAVNTECCASGDGGSEAQRDGTTVDLWPHKTGCDALSRNAVGSKDRKSGFGSSENGVGR